MAAALWLSRRHPVVCLTPAAVFVSNTSELFQDHWPDQSERFRNVPERHSLIKNKSDGCSRWQLDDKEGSCHIIFSFFIGASLLWLAVMMSALLCLLLSTGSVKRTRLISEESLFLRAHTLPATRLRNMNTPTSFSRSRFKSCLTERFMINSGWKQTEKSAEPLFYELLRFSIAKIFFYFFGKY